MKEFLLAILPWIAFPPLALGIWSAIHRRRHPLTPEQRETLVSDDELERRLQGEAGANAVWMYLLWSLEIWLMNEIWPAPHRGHISLGLVFLPVFYVLGMFATKGRLMPAERPNHASGS